jgi:mono/diheme cytochrome c family protein
MEDAMHASRAALLAGLMVLTSAPGGRSGDKPNYDAKMAAAGATFFKVNCASCHGVDARGDGPIASQLRFAPADLTRLSRRNGGDFPTEKVYKTIDGREGATAHGGSDMPIWGDSFRVAKNGYSEKAAKEKIDRLVEYLKSIQEPPEKP